MEVYGFDESKNKVEVPSETKTGDLTQLETTNKNDIVSAINEVFQFANDGKSTLAAAIGNGATASMTWEQLAAKVIKTHTRYLASNSTDIITAPKAFNNVIAVIGYMVVGSDNVLIGALSPLVNGLGSGSTSYPYDNTICATLTESNGVYTFKFVTPHNFSCSNLCILQIGYN